MILDSIRVCELASGISGPYAGLRLGDLGASVVKVETGPGDWTRQAEPRTPEGGAALHAWLNRGKRSLALGGEPSAWRGVVAPLADSSDILITDLPDEALDEAGLGDLVRRSAEGHGEVIVVRVSPFGPEGPFAGRAGSEVVIQAMAGYTRYLGAHGEPPMRLGADVASVGCGIFAAQAALAAVFHRKRGGGVQSVDVSQLGALMSLKAVHLAAQSEPDDWGGPRLGGANDPPEKGWKTADRPITFAFGGSIGAEGRPGWVNFVEEVGLSELLQDDRFDKNGRSSTGLGPKARALKAEYESRFRDLPADMIVDTVRKHGGIAAAFNTHSDVLKDPQTDAVGMIRELDDGQKVTRFPGAFSRVELEPAGRAPALGEHSRQIAAELGIADGMVETMIAEGILVSGGKDE